MSGVSRLLCGLFLLHSSLLFAASQYMVSPYSNEKVDFQRLRNHSYPSGVIASLYGNKKLDLPNVEFRFEEYLHEPAVNFLNALRSRNYELADRLGRDITSTSWVNKHVSWQLAGYLTELDRYLFDKNTVRRFRAYACTIDAFALFLVDGGSTDLCLQELAAQSDLSFPQYTTLETYTGLTSSYRSSDESSFLIDLNGAEEGFKGRFLVDTGSTISIFAKDTVNQELEGIQVYTRGIAGNSVPLDVMKLDKRLNFKLFSVSHQILVNKEYEFSVLGMDVLSKFDRICVFTEPFPSVSFSPECVMDYSNSIPMFFAPSGIPYIEKKINGIVFKLMLDLGAQDTFVSRKKEQFDERVDGDEVDSFYYVGAGGYKFEVLRKHSFTEVLSLVELNLDLEINPILVFPKYENRDPNRHYTIYLGYDFFRQLGSFYFDFKKMRFGVL